MSPDKHAELTPVTSKHKTFIVIAVLMLVAVIAAVYHFKQPTENLDSQGSKAEGKRGNGEGRRGKDDAATPIAVAIETTTQADFPVYLNGLGTNRRGSRPIEQGRVVRHYSQRERRPAPWPLLEEPSGGQPGQQR